MTVEEAEKWLAPNLGMILRILRNRIIKTHMTLIIAGKNFINNTEGFFGESLENHGVFIATDSAISTLEGRKTLLNGFRKVYSIPIKVLKPYFVDDLFHGYLGHKCFEGECTIAIAGNTLTAQHVINAVTDTLSNLKLAHQREDRSSDIEYIAFMPSEDDRNPLLNPPMPVRYKDDTYTQDYCTDVINAEMLSEFVEHSIQNAISSARQYKLDEHDIKSLETEFILVFQKEPGSEENEIYKYLLQETTDGEGLIQLNVIKEKVLDDDIAIIGMHSDYYEPALKVFRSAEKNESPAKKCMEFLNKTISDRQESDVAFPTTLFEYKEGKLKRTKDYHDSE